jgi:hypothetical protein
MGAVDRLKKASIIALLTLRTAESMMILWL